MSKKWFKIQLWKAKFLFCKYVLRHEYTCGVDVASQDLDTAVIVRKNKKGMRFIEKIFNF